MSRASMDDCSQSFPALAEFKANLPHFTLEPLKEPESAPSRPSFVRTSQLCSWLSAEANQGFAKFKNIEHLLDDAFRKRHGSEYLLPDIDEIWPLYPLVFSILLEGDMGHLISAVIRQDISDANLCALSRKSLRHKLWKVSELDYRSDCEERRDQHRRLCKLFSERRWAYRPHVFKYRADPELGHSVILPIYRQQRIVRQRGGTAASIHQLCIPEEYLDDNMKNNLKDSCYEQKSVGKCYYLVVKTFIQGKEPGDQAKHLFQKEYDAYMHLRKHKGMVRYLGSYTHQKLNGLAEHNILLEFGDYDLAEYFLFSPPILPRNVRYFWHNLFAVASALSGLHKFRRKRLGTQEDYWGWHADIKPDNILMVEGQLKLADPGFAGFARLVQGENAPRTRIAAMNSTYAPPECHSPNAETEMPQAADMWSFGCVLSEAATWLILGPPGLAQYTKLRKDAIQRAFETRRRSTPRDPRIPGDADEYDYFHDGECVLLDVRQWHQYLLANVRKNDQISERILEIIDDKLLRTRPQDRFSNAEGLCTALDKIRDLVPEGLPGEQSVLVPAIEDVVIDVEARLKSQPMNSIWGQNDSIQYRKALKSRDHLELPRDNVAHLSDMIKHRIEGAVPKPALSLAPTRVSRLSSNPILITSPTTMSPLDELNAFGLPHISTQRSQEVNSFRRRPTASSLAHRAQSIFDVHYAKDDPKGLARFRSFSDIRNGGKRKDVQLAEHYKDRDIKFLVDNGCSMSHEWQKVRFVLEKIAKKAYGIDKDGMELEFVNSHHPTIKLPRNHVSTIIEQVMEKYKPGADTKTDMATKLGQSLREWFKDTAKSVTLIILTDGCWQGMKDVHDLEDKIVQFDADLKRIPGETLVERQVSIQFISFGDDQDALRHLRYLDDDLAIDRDINDIVDTEPWAGDVYKMLLGSHVPDFDLMDDYSDRNEDLQSTVQRHEQTYPPSQHDQSYSRRTPTRQERHSSYPAQSRASTQSTPRAQPQPSQYQPREIAHRQKPSNDYGGYYRSVA